MLARVRVALLISAGVLLHTLGFGQWTGQTIRLVPGWNAVYFEVDPEPRFCDDVFRSVPVESVWAWNRRFTSVQYVQDPTTLLPSQPEWLTYFPPSSPQSFLTNLFLVQGGRPYLVKLGGTQAVYLTLTGRPKIRALTWMSNSFNFVGGHVDNANPPTFAAFFGPSPAHAGQQIYRMSAGGQWQLVSNPGSATMRRGEAYWVYCRGESDYQGPLSVGFDSGDGVDYGRVLMEYTLSLKNAAASNRTVTLRQTSSRQPPGTSYPLLAGPVPLSWFENDLPNHRYGWTPLAGALSVAIPAGKELSVRLAVRRPQMPPFMGPVGRDYLYQSLLQLTDGAGSLLELPVSAKGLDSPLLERPAAARARARGGPALLAAPPTVNPRAGLWVGEVTVKAVSNPTSVSLNPWEPIPVASPFTFRLIVHVDAGGQPRLLQQVLQMWKDGAWIPNPNDPTSATYMLDPNNPGRTVLLTDDSLIPRYAGVALHDVKLVGRRISSAAFGMRTPLAMGGGPFGLAGAAPTTCTVALDYRDPVNPFQHKYHPDHDNFDERYEQTLPEGRESYTVARNIALQFTAQDPDDLAAAGWGDDQIGGVYAEAIWGVHRRVVNVSGTFRLQRISDVDVLNDGVH